MKGRKDEMRRIFCILMVFVLWIGTFPFQAFGYLQVGMSGDGSAGNPYIITTLDQLNAVRNDLDAHYRLGADIDASDTASWNNGEGFIPIGTVGIIHSEFNGSLDGAGYVIRNLTIHRPHADVAGLFGVMGSSGVLQDVALEGGSITGKLDVGGLTGRNYGRVDRSFVTGTVSSNEGIVGGVAGYNGIDGEITFSYSTGDVSGVIYVGGLVGRNDGKVSNSYATGTISGTSIIGGLVGDNEGGEIIRSYAAGAVSGSAEHVGGLVGFNISASIRNSYATGTVSGRSGIGGLVGSTSHGLISHSYATGYVNGSNHIVGGLVGDNSGEISSSFWDTETVGLNSACGNDTYNKCAATPLTTAQALIQTSYPDWDFTNDWFMVEDSTRPFLRTEWSTVIQNSHQLQLMELDLSAQYTLSKNINFEATFKDDSRSDMWATGAGHGYGFEPIGSRSTSFTGTLDGQGHAITGLYIHRNGLSNVGLFGHISGGEVRDLDLKSGFISGDSYTGMLAGETDSGSQITQVHATGSVTGTSMTGGLVGNHYGKLTGSSSSATINGQFNVGGLVGHLDMGGEINRSFAASYVTGMDFVGGLVGRNERGQIHNAYATGSVSGRAEVGGLVGRNVGKIGTTYAAGQVKGSNEVGGLVGRKFDTITASLYNLETSGQSDTGKGEPQKTSNMKQYSAYGSEWDFGATWLLQEGKMYPVLQGITSNLEWDAAPPTIVSAKIESDHPDRVIVTFDEDVRLTDAAGIAITANGNSTTITGVDGTGTKELIFSVDQVFEENERVQLSYDMAAGNITDAANHALLGVTDVEIVWMVPADHTPPSIVITMTTADGREYVDGSWSDQAVSVSAEASDERGVTSFTYSLDDEVTWSPYVSDIVLQDDGVHRITFKAVDTEDNEAVEQRTVNISTTGITLTPTLVKADGSEYVSGEWSTANVIVSVYAESGVNGINGLTYSLNGGAIQPYDNKGNLEISNEGEHTILFQVSNAAGDTLSLTILVKIDRTPPTITIHPNGSEIQTAAVTPTVTVTDTGSRPDASSLEYVWTTDMSAPTAGWMSFVDGAMLGKNGVEGDWYLHVRARDQAGNAGNLTSSRYRLITKRIDEANETKPTHETNVPSLPSNSFLVGAEGRTIVFDGGQVRIPAKALKRPFYVTIHQLTLQAVPPLREGERWVSKVIELKKDVSGKFDEDVTISLKFDVDSSRKDSDELRLYQFNEDLKEWVELDNVVVDWLAGTVSGTTDHFSTFAVVERKIVQEPGIGAAFTDIQGHWAEKNIEKLAGTGIVNGYIDGSFKPDRTISRAEFTAMLVRALGLTSDGSNTFDDMADHWAKQAVSAAYSNGIIQGYDQRTFAPDDFITREQMAVMVVNALRINQTITNRSFADQDKISTWAHDAVMIATAYGIITGYPNNMLKPKSQATRAEAITVILRATE